MNSLIEKIFTNFTVDKVKIPVAFLTYEGHNEPYITYQLVDSDNVFNADDEIEGWVEYYDFDVYSKGNFSKIIKSVKQLMKQNGFMWQSSKSSGDFYENDTGYYHRTLCFAILREE